MDVPMISIFMGDDGEYAVPPKWATKFLQAEIEDYRHGRTFLGTFSASWEHRRAIERQFMEAIKEGGIPRAWKEQNKSTTVSLTS